MVQFFFPIIAVLSFGPALLMLYVSLSKYTWPKSEVARFDDRWIFGLLAVGIIVGAILVFTEEVTLAGGGGFVFAILFIVIQELFVLVILNFPRVRRKGSGRFYGYSLGTSIAAGIALGEYGIVFSGASYFDIPTLLILLVYTFGLELLGGSTGSIIGYSIESNGIPRGVAVAVALQVIYSFILLPVFSFQPSVLTMLFDLGSLGVAVIVYVAVITRVLPAERVRGTDDSGRRMM